MSISLNIFPLIIWHSLLAPRSKGKQVVLLQNHSPPCCAAVQRWILGNNLDCIAAKKEGWKQQLWGRAQNGWEGHSGFILHLLIPPSSYSACAVLGGEMLFQWSAEWMSGMQWKTVHRQRSMILHKWFIWLLLTWCYNFLTLTSIIIIVIIIIIKRTWISDTSNWSIENKIPMKSYRYPTTIYCCVNRWLFVREIQPREREEKRKEKKPVNVSVSQSGKTKNLSMNHTGGEKNSGKSRQLDEKNKVNSVKLTRWRSWSHAVNRILPSNNNSHMLFQNQTCIGYFSGVKRCKYSTFLAIQIL